MATETFKVIPLPADWAESTMDIVGNIECPVCHSLISRDSVARHTDWHRTLSRIIELMSG